MKCKTLLHSVQTISSSSTLSTPFFENPRGQEFSRYFACSFSCNHSPTMTVVSGWGHVCEGNEQLPSMHVSPRGHLGQACFVTSGYSGIVLYLCGLHSTWSVPSHSPPSGHPWQVQIHSPSPKTPFVKAPDHCPTESVPGSHLLHRPVAQSFLYGGTHTHAQVSLYSPCSTNME